MEISRNYWAHVQRFEENVARVLRGGPLVVRPRPRVRRRRGENASADSIRGRQREAGLEALGGKTRMSFGMLQPQMFLLVVANVFVDVHM